MLEGIQYVVDANGKIFAVQIDLNKHGALWEDIYDNLVAEARKDEPRLLWEEVKKRMTTSAIKK